MAKVIIAIIASVIIVTVLSFTAIYIFMDEKAYNKVMMYYISDRVINGNKNFEEKVQLLRNFVYENVRSVHKAQSRADTVGVDRLTWGVGHCDQMSRVFIQLAKHQKITARLLFLLNESGSSPHSIAEAWDGNRWVVVDPTYNLQLYNKENKMASTSDIKDDIDILYKNERIKIFALYNPRWKDKEFLSMYYRTPVYVNTKKGKNHYILNYTPGFAKQLFVNLIQDIYIFKNKNQLENFSEYLYFKARNFHLAGRLKDAKRLYKEVLRSDTSGRMKDRALFFLAVFLKDSGRYEEGLMAASRLIRDCANKGWLPHAYDLRSRIYAILGDEEASQREIVEIGKLQSEEYGYF